MFGKNGILKYNFIALKGYTGKWILRLSVQAGGVNWLGQAVGRF